MTEKAAVVPAGLHHHRKIGQLGGAVVNVQTIEVVLQNAGHSIAGRVAVVLVDLHQYIE